MMLLTGAALSGAPAVAHAHAAAQAAPAVAQANNGSSTYVVVFNDDKGMAGALDDQIASFASDNNAQVVYKYDTINGVAINLPDGNADKLKELGNVKYVEKDITFNVSLDTATGIVGAPQVWDLGYTGKGVTVALVDTGIDANHPDLKGRVVDWKDFINGRDEPYDDYGHGTHCAGIIGGSGAASGGKYKGVAPGVQFIGVKVLDKNGAGSLSSIVKGVDYASRTDAKIISMSLGSSQHSQAMDDVVAKAVKRGKIVVCAAGNSGPDARTIGCPGDSPDVISVGATDKNDVIASFSSRGPARDGLQKPDVCAPGKGIVSCKAAGLLKNKAIDTYYVSMSGTSMATPMVAGSLALLVQKDPQLTPQEAKSLLEKTSKKVGTASSKCPNCDYGYGRISVKSALDSLGGNKTMPSPTPSPTKPPVSTPQPGYPEYPYPSYPGYPYPYSGADSSAAAE